MTKRPTKKKPAKKAPAEKTASKKAPAKRGRGRPPKKKLQGYNPPKFTRATVEIIIARIKEGNFLETAAAAAGVSREIVRRWLKDGMQAKSGMKREFALRANQAFHESEAKMVKGLADNPAWQAQAWILERRHADRWRRKIEIETTVQPKNLFEGRTPGELEFYSRHGYFEDNAPEQAGVERDEVAQEG